MDASTDVAVKRFRWDTAALIILITAACLVTIWPDVHGFRVDTQRTLPVTGLDGKPLPLPAWREHVVVLNFWSPDCAPCMEELPMLQQISTHYKTSELSVVGVAMQYDDPVQVAATSASVGLTYPQGWDASGRMRQMFGGVTVIPTTVVLAPGGRVIFRHEGGLTAKTLDALAEAYLPYSIDNQDPGVATTPVPAKR